MCFEIVCNLILGIWNFMVIGIDISQIAHEGTGVATYVRRMVASLVRLDKKNRYVFFGASLRKRYVFDEFVKSLGPATNMRLVSVPIPPTVLEILWNRLHIFPVELFTGPVDVFWSSDWTQPPLARAKGVTTIHDLTVFVVPDETDKRIVEAQTRRTRLAAHSCRAFFCDSEATKRDFVKAYRLPERNVTVVYPGIA